LDNSSVRIVAKHAVENHMLTLVKLFILFVVLNKSVLCIDGFDLIPAVARSAFFRVSRNLHRDTHGILDMQAAWTVTGFTFYPRLSPGPHNTRKLIL
jgi:hypothetical protein